MKLTLLGSGGGRFVTIDQVRETGGFVLEIAGKMLMFDPGPGALINSKKYKINLKRLDGIFVSHSHLDHINDLNIVIEAMTGGAKKKRGFLVADKVTVNGGKGEPARITDYHRAPLESIHVMKEDDKIKIGDIKVLATKSTHEERKPDLDFGNNKIPTHGYVLDTGKERFGYTSDGEYYPGMEDYFQNCDLLIMNCMRPPDAPWPGQMNVKQAKELIQKTKPGIALLNHFGMRMLFGRAEKEAKLIQKETGVKTIAARDGMVIDTKKVQSGKINNYL